MPSHSILYVGHDLILLEILREALEDCRMVRCPGGSGARTLIESRISYSLLLLDEELPGTTGRDLTHSARGEHRQRTLIIILSASEAGCVCPGVCFQEPDDPESLVKAIKRLLAAVPSVEG